MINEFVTLPMKASPTPSFTIAVAEVIDISNIAYAVVVRPSTYMFIFASLIEPLIKPYLDRIVDDSKVYVEKQIADAMKAAATQLEEEEEVIHPSPHTWGTTDYRPLHYRMPTAQPLIADRYTTECRPMQYEMPTTTLLNADRYTTKC